MPFKAYNELTYKVALAMLRGATCDVVRRMQEYDVTPEEFFNTEQTRLTELLECRPLECFDTTYREEALRKASKEEEFINRHNIHALLLGDKGYPVRMESCHSAPILLFKLGDCDLNGEHNVGVVGTRKITPYGADTGRKLIKELGEYFPDITIWSGLAFGADAVAHTTALDEDRATVAVVAHGLHTIYPAAHRDLARRIVKNGGAIVSEYPSGTSAYRGRFLERNRIVAWSTDATIVLESEIKGGAMSTANHAFQENRDVFALPGRANDPMSAGCNHLIRKQKAGLITAAADLIEVTGWRPAGVVVSPKMRCLFPELEGEGKAVYDALRMADEPLSLDMIHMATGLPIATLLGTLTELEFDSVVIKHPGNRYSPA